MATQRKRPANAKPLLELDTAEGEARDVPMEPLLKRDGVTYSIPVKISADIALQYLELTTTVGVGAALVWGLKRLLGPDGYEALATFPNLTNAELGKISGYVQNKLFGALDDPKA